MSPILTRNVLSFISHSAEQTRRIGKRLGRMLQSGDVICLEGDLGAGKTCLTQGIGAGLGIRTAVRSPTFVIVNEYRLPDSTHTFHHVDLYRIQSTAEARATGLEEIFYGDGICVIEWAERVRDILPDERLWVALRYVDHTKREMQFEAQGERFETLMDRLRRESFGL